MKFEVVSLIKYPCNKDVVSKSLALFSEANHAVQFAKLQAKERHKYDSTTPYNFVVYNKAKE